jgi:hypothetical protein
VIAETLKENVIDLEGHASTHQWIAGLPMQDLVVALDDADGRILYARFLPQRAPPRPSQR